MYNDLCLYHGRVAWLQRTSDAQKYNLVYLHHQCSDEADILQFVSTHEYFETVEYELHSRIGVRDTR